jgi:hypothetical protein
VPPRARGTGRSRACGALGAILAVCGAVQAVPLLAAPAAPTPSRWSAPARLAGCASAAPPLIVFPSSTPQTRSGPGVLLWTGPHGCNAGGVAPTAGAPEAFGSQLGGGDLPSPGRPLVGGTGDLGELTAAAGTASGRILIVGSGATASETPVSKTPANETPVSETPASGGGAAGMFVEGSEASTAAGAQPLEGPASPVAACSGYLGDTVLVSSTETRGTPMRKTAGRGAMGLGRVATAAPARRVEWELAVRTQRHYSDSLGAPRLLPIGPEQPSALAVAMDYRSDVLVVWASSGGIYAREITQTGAVEPLHRLGSDVGASELRALLSDDGHAIVAWRSQATTGGGQATIRGGVASTGGGVASTSIEVSISGPELSFRAPVVVERFRDPRGLALPPGSLRLTRLSSEAVMLAWTGVSGGRYVVRASPVSLRRGVWAPVRISTPGTEALLAALVPGPRAEALALWTTAPRLRDGALDPRRRAIVAAWGHYAGHGEAVFAAPETVAAAGPNGTPAAAFDPQSDRALAAWVGLGRGGAPRISYALRAAGPP